jgi:hypothetical protein
LSKALRGWWFAQASAVVADLGSARLTSSNGVNSYASTATGVILAAFGHRGGAECGLGGLDGECGKKMVSGGCQALEEVRGRGERQILFTRDVELCRKKQQPRRALVTKEDMDDRAMAMSVMSRLRRSGSGSVFGARKGRGGGVRGTELLWRARKCLAANNKANGARVAEERGARVHLTSTAGPCRSATAIAVAVKVDAEKDNSG